MTGFDWFLIAVVTISALLAVFRGFVGEVLSVAALVGAVVVTLLAMPYLTDLQRPFFEPGLIAGAATALLSFVVLYVFFTFLANRVANVVPAEGGVGALNRLGGFVFGALRGVLLVSILYAAYDVNVDRPDQPRWIVEARLHPYLSYGSDLVATVARRALSGPDQDDYVQEERA
jgi:membrane protein required for colicin V production